MKAIMKDTARLYLTHNPLYHVANAAELYSAQGCRKDSIIHDLPTSGADAFVQFSKNFSHEKNSAAKTSNYSSPLSTSLQNISGFEVVQVRTNSETPTGLRPWVGRRWSYVGHLQNSKTSLNIFPKFDICLMIHIGYLITKEIC